MSSSRTTIMKRLKLGDRKIDIQSGTHTETIKDDTKITVTTGAYTHYVAARSGAESFEAGVTSFWLPPMRMSMWMAATSIQLHVGESTLWMEKWVAKWKSSSEGRNRIYRGRELSRSQARLRSEDGGRAG